MNQIEQEKIAEAISDYGTHHNLDKMVRSIKKVIEMPEVDEQGVYELGFKDGRTAGLDSAKAYLSIEGQTLEQAIKAIDALINEKYEGEEDD